jgi:hypothetical protein
LSDSCVDLYWIPLRDGPGGALVRWSGRVYEAVVAARDHRPRRALFHSALKTHVNSVTSTIEMAPVWVQRGIRGVVTEGPVGARSLGRSRLFRYEVRCWPGGSIPDASATLGGRVRVASSMEQARRTVDLVPQFPTYTWGRDELHTGDMWNSNTLVSWLLVRAGIDMTEIGPPSGGRAPGWAAGVIAVSSESAQPMRRSQQ